MSHDDPDCKMCEDHLWRLVEKGEYTYAEPCPSCKPRSSDAYLKGEWSSRKAITKWHADRDGRGKQSDEDKRKKNIERAKREFSL